MFAHIWWFVEISESAFTSAIIPHISEYHGYHGYHGWLVGIQIISNYAWNPSRLCISLNSAVSPAKKILPCCCYQLQALSGSRLRKSSVTPPKAATGNRGNSWQGKSQSQAAASVGVTMPFWQSGQTYPNPQRHTMLHNVLSLPSLCGRHVCSHRMTKHIKTWQNMTNHLKDS